MEPRYVSAVPDPESGCAGEPRSRCQRERCDPPGPTAVGAGGLLDCPRPVNARVGPGARGMCRPAATSAMVCTRQRDALPRFVLVGISDDGGLECRLVQHRTRIEPDACGDSDEEEARGEDREGGGGQSHPCGTCSEHPLAGSPRREVAHFDVA